MTGQSLPKMAYRISEAAIALGQSRSAMYNLLHTTDIPRMRVGQVTRIPVEPLKEWIRRHTRLVKQEHRSPDGDGQQTSEPWSVLTGKAANRDVRGQLDGPGSEPGDARTLLLADLRRARNYAANEAAKLTRRLNQRDIACVGCGVVFRQTHGRKRYCSRNCRRRTQYRARTLHESGYGHGV